MVVVSDPAPALQYERLDARGAETGGRDGASETRPDDDGREVRALGGGAHRSG